MPNVAILYSHTVSAIKGEVMVENLVIKDVKTGEERDLAVNGVFIAVGIHPDTEICRELVACDESGYVLAGEDTATSVRGIYAAGDIRKKPLRQIITAVADGANAASAAGAFLAEHMM